MQKIMFFCVSVFDSKIFFSFVLLKAIDNSTVDSYLCVPTFVLLQIRKIPVTVICNMFFVSLSLTTNYSALIYSKPK
jgi:hypothetical protein